MLTAQGGTCPACSRPIAQGARFCDKCGHRLDAGSGGGGGDGTWTVGREGAIPLDGEGVSRQHLALRVQGGVITVTDLGSSNGTWVGSERLAANVARTVTANTLIGLGQDTKVTVDQLLQAARRQSRG